MGAAAHAAVPYLNQIEMAKTITLTSPIKVVVNGKPSLFNLGKGRIALEVTEEGLVIYGSNGNRVAKTPKYGATILPDWTRYTGSTLTAQLEELVDAAKTGKSFVTQASLLLGALIPTAVSVEERTQITIDGRVNVTDYTFEASYNGTRFRLVITDNNGTYTTTGVHTDNGQTLPMATATSLGAVKVGGGLQISATGVLSTTASGGAATFDVYKLPGYISNLAKATTTAEVKAVMGTVADLRTAFNNGKFIFGQFQWYNYFPMSLSLGGARAVLSTLVGVVAYHWELGIADSEWTGAVNATQVNIADLQARIAALEK